MAFSTKHQALEAAFRGFKGPMPVIPVTKNSTVTHHPPRSSAGFWIYDSSVTARVTWSGWPYAYALFEGDAIGRVDVNGCVWFDSVTGIFLGNNK